MDAFEHKTPLELDPQQISAFASEIPNEQLDQQTTQKQTENRERPSDSDSDSE
jgi:hypothetical protein